MSIPWPETVCPACMAETTAPLAAGGRLCLVCRHEWDPATTDGPLDQGVPMEIHPYPVSEMSLPPTAEPPDLARELARARELYVGKAVVVYDYEVEGTCTDITPDGIAVVDIGDGFIVHAGPEDFTLAEVDALPTPDIVELGAVDMTVAAMALDAAVQTFVGEGDERELGIPPTGWLPRDPDAWLVIEHGIGYALAIVAQVFGISTDELVELAVEVHKAALAAGEIVTK